MTLALSLLAGLALVFFIRRLTLPPKMAPHGTMAAVQQQKAIRTWALSSSAAVLFFIAGLLGLATPAVPWLAIQYTYQGGVSQYIVISMLSVKAQTCNSGTCQDLDLGLAYSNVIPALLPSASLQYWGAIFFLVGGVISTLIALHLKRQAHSGLPSSSLPCIHSPAAQGFAWTGFCLYFIGAAEGGAVFIEANNRLFGNELGAAPGGVMAAFVVLVSLTGCVITAVANCQIWGVTGVGQSTTNCCCRQEGGGELEGGEATAATQGGFKVIMTPSLEMAVNNPLNNPLGNSSSGAPLPTASFALTDSTPNQIVLHEGR